MSKFLNVFLPAAGGTALVLAVSTQFAHLNVNRMSPVEARLLAGGAMASAAAETGEAVGAEPAAPGGVEIAQADTGSMTDAGETRVVGREGGFGLGREALAEEIAAWDIDVRPDGQGLPEGSGSVMDGEPIYIAQCAVCHGDFGEAIGRWPQLAGGEDTLSSMDPVKTPGSYWPYLSTIYDYVHRAMPFGNAQSLSDDEVYALTAYILYLNFIVDDDFVLSKETFGEVEMPNAGGFFMDDRAEVELPKFSGDVCMEDCKETVEITKRAAVLDVTPDETAAAEGGETEGEPAETEMAAAESDADAVAGTSPEETAPEEVDVALIAAGENVFRKCQACHMVGEDAKNRVGPQLNGVVGRTIGGVDGFRYSGVFEDARDTGEVWTEEHLAAFLANPRGEMKGTKMAFAGLKSDEDIAAIIAYLESFE